MTRLHQSCVTARPGYSRSDVLVAIVVVVLLGALVGPLIQTQNRKRHPLECRNNMRQVLLAIHNFAATTSEGHLPPLTTSFPPNPSERQQELVVGWPIVLLPALDQAPLYKKIKQTAAVQSGHVRVPDTERIWLQTMTCPEDLESYQKPGGLSYVVNAGFISRDLYGGDPDRKHLLGSLSWNDNDIPGEPADIVVHAATGVMWNPSKAFQPSLDYVSEGDGTTTTLLVTENLQAGDWFDTDTARISFGFPVVNTNTQVPFGTGATFESTDKHLNTQFDGGTLSTAASQDWRINSDLKAKPGTRPRPSSNHKDGVNVAMCDGSIRYLSQNIDPHVYLKLLTPNGATYGEGKLEQSQY